jgi:hypothetical protein
MDNLNLNLNSKTSNAVIHEAGEFFREQGYSVVGNGFGEVVGDPRLSQSYINALCEGIEDANRRAEMSQLLNNAAEQTLLNESLNGISPLSSLSMPVVRKLWPKCVMKDAMKTIVATAPIFTIAYTKPYLSKIDADGVEVRKELPRGVFTHDADGAYETPYAASWGEDRVIEKEIALAAANTFVEAELIAKNKLAKTPLDKELELVEVKYTAQGAEKSVFIGKKVGLEPVIIADIETPALAEIPAGPTGDPAKVDAVKTMKGQIIVRVDFANGLANAAFIGEIPAGLTGLKVVLRARKSSEWNEEGWDVMMDIARQEVTIGTGEHLNAPITVSYLQDVKALYNIDALAEIADLMTNTFAQKLDYELINFMIECFLKRPKNSAYPVADGYHAMGEHLYRFDVKPAAGYAGSPTAWRSEIKTVIEHAATKLMTETYLQSGTFVIVGNPLDTALLKETDWQYKQGTSGNIDGTDINYTTGVFQGTYVYKVISSINFEPGKLILSFIPSGDKQLCQAYYPYSFTMEKGNGYRSPNHSLVPNLMMTKRHTYYEFMPCTALIAIENNTGTGQFNTGNVYTKQF